MLRVLLPQELADQSRTQLVEAMKALGEAQQALARALETLDGFAVGFRSGRYKEEPFGFPHVPFEPDHGAERSNA